MVSLPIRVVFVQSRDFCILIRILLPDPPPPLFLCSCRVLSAGRWLLNSACHTGTFPCAMAKTAHSPAQQTADSKATRSRFCTATLLKPRDFSCLDLCAPPGTVTPPDPAACASPHVALLPTGATESRRRARAAVANLPLTDMLRDVPKATMAPADWH